MVYILGTNLSDKKKIKLAFQQIFGIGPAKSSSVLKQLGLTEQATLKDLDSEQLNNVIRCIESSSSITSNDLRRTVTDNKKRLLSIKSYRGFRHRYGLPLRGQRTRTNARTQKKNKLK